MRGNPITAASASRLAEEYGFLAIPLGHRKLEGASAGYTSRTQTKRGQGRSQKLLGEMKVMSSLSLKVGLGPDLELNR